MITYRGAFYRHSGKTYRDVERYKNVTLYHASPERVTRLAPRSKFFGKSGVFMSPSYRSLIIDWAPWVLGKKYHHHPLEKQRKQLVDDWYDLKEKPDKTDEEVEQTDQLKARLDKTNKSLGDYLDSATGYQRVYVYRVHCPKWVYDASVELFDAAYDAGYLKDSFGFWAWGDQVFIPREYMSHLRILSTTEYDVGDLYDEYWNISHRKPVWFPKRKEQ